MKPPSVRELLATPELALVPALLAALDGLLATMRAQHGTIQHEWQPGDPTSLVAARALTVELRRARRAVVRYARALRRAHATSRPLDHSLPF